MFPLGVARRSVTDALHHFLQVLEDGSGRQRTTEGCRGPAGRRSNRPSAALADDLEQRPLLPDVTGRERLRGYAVTGLPFRSGHLLAMRRFPASSIGPAYTSVWHRDPTGRLVVYQDQEPLVGCARVFGPEIDEVRIGPIALDWTEPHQLRIDLDIDGHRLRWDLALTATPVVRALNTILRTLPPALKRNRWSLALAGRLTGPLLRIGRVRLTGRVPTGQRFAASPHSLWIASRSSASIDGDDLGPAGTLDHQAHLNDFWLPRRGLFAFADALFEPSTPPSTPS